MLTAKQITHLRKCPKVETEDWMHRAAPTKEHGDHLRGGIDLQAGTGRTDLPGTFHVYTRQRARYPRASPLDPRDDFSVGLVYREDGHDVHVVRLNGSHAHWHTNPWPKRNGQPHAEFVMVSHIHYLTAYYLARDDPCGFALPSRQYHDLSDALKVLGRRVHIESQQQLLEGD